MKTFFKMALANKNTTLFGVLAFLASALDQAKFMCDGIDTTNPDWGIPIAILLTALGLAGARDSTKSSKSTGLE